MGRWGGSARVVRGGEHEDVAPDRGRDPERAADVTTVTDGGSVSARRTLHLHCPEGRHLPESEQSKSVLHLKASTPLKARVNSTANVYVGETAMTLASL